MTTTLENPETIETPDVLARRRPAFLKRVFGVVGGLLALGMLLLIVYPLGATVVRVLFPGGMLNVDAFAAVLQSAEFWKAALNTLIVLGTSGLLALVIGTIFAWLSERTDARMGFISKILPVLPLLVPSVAMSIGWIFLAQETSGSLNVALRWLAGLVGIEMQTGPLNISSWPGLIFVYTLDLVPFVFLIVSVAFRNLDPSYEEAARINGAGRLRTFLRISASSVLPAIASAALVVGIAGIGLFSAPTIIGSGARIDVLSTMTVRFIRGTYPPRIAEGVVIGLMMMIVIAALWLVQRKITSRQRHATIGGKAGGSSLVELGRWRGLARTVILAFVAMSTVLPFGALLLVALQPFWSPVINLGALSFQHFEQLFDGGIVTRAITTSLSLGLVGATIGMVIAAILMEYARDRRGWRGSAVLGVTKLPGAITHIVLGIGFLVVLGSAPFNLQGTVVILLLAYLAIYMPQASTAAGSAIDLVGTDLIEAARMSGAGKGRVFRRVTFPLMLPGLAAGWAMIFVVMVGDLTASALLAGTSNPVVGFVTLEIWENGTYSQLAALSALITVICVAAVSLVLYFGRTGQRREPRRRRA